MASDQCLNRLHALFVTTVRLRYQVRENKNYDTVLQFIKPAFTSDSNIN